MEIILVVAVVCTRILQIVLQIVVVGVFIWTPVSMPVGARMSLGVYAVEDIVHHAIQVKLVPLSVVIADMLEKPVVILQCHAIPIFMNVHLVSKKQIVIMLCTIAIGIQAKESAVMDQQVMLHF